MLDRLIADIAAFFETSPKNVVGSEDAMREDLVGLRLFDTPLACVAAADDPMFEALKAPEAVHPEYRTPDMWLCGARSVVSVFAPFTKQVKESNAKDMAFPSDEWQHGRIEGQDMLTAAGEFLCEWFTREGYHAVAPSLSPEFRSLSRFAVTWSERHTAYIAGLGTFGISKGLITEKGVAGRFVSVVTDCALPATRRAYGELYEYCSRCGKCARNCPTGCIDPARGPHGAKAHAPCSDFLDGIRSLPPRGASNRSRYGCGKCQVAVPCQDRIPVRR